MRRGGETVEADAEVVEEHLGGHRRAMSAAGDAGPAPSCGDAVAQLLRAGQVEAAPRPRLGLVAELLERVGLEQRGPSSLSGSANTTWLTTSATQR